MFFPYVFLSSLPKFKKRAFVMQCIPTEKVFGYKRTASRWSCVPFQPTKMSVVSLHKARHICTGGRCGHNQSKCANKTAPNLIYFYSGDLFWLWLYKKNLHKILPKTHRQIKQSLFLQWKGCWNGICNGSIKWNELHNARSKEAKSVRLAGNAVKSLMEGANEITYI